MKIHVGWYARFTLFNLLKWKQIVKYTHTDAANVLGMLNA